MGVLGQKDVQYALVFEVIVRFVICYSIFVKHNITVFSNIVIEYVETIIVHEFCLEKYRQEGLKVYVLCMSGGKDILYLSSYSG